MIRLEPNRPPHKKGAAWPLAVWRLRSDWRQGTAQQRYGALNGSASGKDAYYVDELDSIAALWTVLSLFGLDIIVARVSCAAMTKSDGARSGVIVYFIGTARARAARLTRRRIDLNLCRARRDGRYPT